MVLEDLLTDIFDEGGIPSVVEGGTPYVEHVQKLKPIEKGLGRITNQVLFVTGDNNFISKSVVGGIDDNGDNFVREFVYVGKSSYQLGKAGGEKKKIASDEEMEAFKKYIEKSPWREAKTFANYSPHEYIISYPCWKMKVENKCSNNCEKCKKARAEFEKWVKFIREYGEKVMWGKSVFTCLRCGDKHYWTMGDVIENTWVLNRAVTNDPRYKVPVRWLDRGE